VCCVCALTEGTAAGEDGATVPASDGQATDQCRRQTRHSTCEQ